jgi:hypothetical protein
MLGIYKYIRETTHVSRVHSVAAVLYVQSVLHSVAAVLYVQSVLHSVAAVLYVQSVLHVMLFRP